LVQINGREGRHFLVFAAKSPVIYDLNILHIVREHKLIIKFSQESISSILGTLAIIPISGY
jgi:hypothetical protein